MSSQQSYVTSIITQIKALFEDSVVNKIVPLIIQAQEDKLAEEGVDHDIYGGGDPISSPTPEATRPDKGKGRAPIQVQVCALVIQCDADLYIS